MTPAEVAAFLDQQRVVICATSGPRGWPHLMPLWYVIRDGEPWATTYAKSQKVRNLERDPRATVLVETGREYAELRGLMVEAEAELHRDFETVFGFAEELTVRYAEGISSVEGDAKAALEAQAPKRVAIQFRPLRTATWDHRKLGGTY
jgi:PPOX class probable F420-dependent enzyme